MVLLQQQQEGQREGGEAAAAAGGPGMDCQLLGVLSHETRGLLETTIATNHHL